MESFQHIVTNNQSKIRIDKLLSDINPDISRSQIQSWITSNLSE